MQPIFSSSCFHTTKANLVFFGDLDGLFDTLCSKFRAGIWPMGWDLQYQHLYHFWLGVLTWTAQTDLLECNWAVARIHHFISTSIQFISHSKVVFSAWCSRPNLSFRMLKLGLTRWSKSQNLPSSPSCRALNFTTSWVIVPDMNLSSPAWILANLVQLENLVGSKLKGEMNQTKHQQTKRIVYLHIQPTQLGP